VHYKWGRHPIIVYNKDKEKTVEELGSLVYDLNNKPDRYLLVSEWSLEAITSKYSLSALEVEIDSKSSSYLESYLLV